MMFHATCGNSRPLWVWSAPAAMTPISIDSGEIGRSPESNEISIGDRLAVRLHRRKSRLFQAALARSG